MTAGVEKTDRAELTSVASLPPSPRLYKSSKLDFYSNGVTANVKWTTRRRGLKNPAHWILSDNAFTY